MLMKHRINSNTRIEFCTGTLLNCLDLLPNFDSPKQLFLRLANFNDIYNISNGRFYTLFNCNADFLTKNTRVNEIPSLIKLLMVDLLENRFYCNHEKEMAEFFFNDLKASLSFNNEHINQKHRQYLLNLIEWPTCAELDITKHYTPSNVLFSEQWKTEWEKQFSDNISSIDDQRFWFTCYYCYANLLKEALLLPLNNKSNDTDFKELFKLWKNEIKTIKKYYVERFVLPKEQRPTLYYFLEAYKKDRFADNFNQAIEPKKKPNVVVKPGYTLEQVKKRLVGIKTNTPSIALRANSKTFEDGNFPVTDPLGKKRKTDFQEIIVPQPGLAFHLKMFDFVDSRSLIDIRTRRISAIKQQYDELLFNVTIQSAKNSKYKPISYRKIHIDSYHKCDISPGNDDLCKFRFDLSPIEYFDHLIMRGYYSGKDQFKAKLKIMSVSRFSSDGFENTPAFFFLAGCGVWVISKDNYLVVSRRGQVYEKPGDIGYSAAGSCEYNSRLQENASIEELEANPFITAARELYEECNIKIKPEDLQLISFGIDYDRYLQQFSFYHHSDMLIDDILETALFAKSSNEQVLFAIPFIPENITALIHDYEMEPGAIVSLIRLWQWLDTCTKS